MANVKQRGIITLELFKARLDNIESIYYRIMETARSLSVDANLTPREAALYADRILDIRSAINQLQRDANVTIAYTCQKTNPNGIDFPPMLNRKQTMLNWENNR